MIENFFMALDAFFVACLIGAFLKLGYDLFIKKDCGCHKKKKSIS